MVKYNFKLKVNNEVIFKCKIKVEIKEDFRMEFILLRIFVCFLVFLLC